MLKSHKNKRDSQLKLIDKIPTKQTYLALLIITLCLCSYIHYKSIRLQKQVDRLEMTKVQLSLDTLDLLESQNNPLNQMEAEALKQMLIRHYYGDQKYATFDKRHLTDSKYISAKIGKIIMDRLPDDIDIKIKYQGKTLSLIDVAKEAYQAGKNLIWKDPHAK